MKNSMAFSFVLFIVVFSFSEVNAQDFSGTIEIQSSTECKDLPVGPERTLCRRSKRLARMADRKGIVVNTIMDTSKLPKKKKFSDDCDFSKKNGCPNGLSIRFDHDGNAEFHTKSDLLDLKLLANDKRKDYLKIDKLADLDLAVSACTKFLDKTKDTVVADGKYEVARDLFETEKKAWVDAVGNFLDSNVASCDEYCNWAAQSSSSAACRWGTKRIKDGISKGCLAYFAGEKESEASLECIESTVRNIVGQKSDTVVLNVAGKSNCKTAMKDLIDARNNYLEASGKLVSVRKDECSVIVDGNLDPDYSANGKCLYFMRNQCKSIIRSYVDTGFCADCAQKGQ